MICSDFILHNKIGDTKVPLLRCIPFISKVKKLKRSLYRTVHELSVPYEPKI